MAFFQPLTSIKGRWLQRSSSGGILTLPTTSGSTVFDTVLMERDSSGTIRSPHDEPVVTTTSTGGTQFTFGGVLVLNSSAVAPAFTISAPRPGQTMYVYNISTASTTITFGGTSTSVLLNKQGVTSAGSTILTMSDAAPFGAAFMLVGLSATRMGIISQSTVLFT